MDSLGGPPSQYSELPTAEEDDVEPVAPAASQEPGAGDVEAAAEHFAAGLRSPEDVERELLSDLEQPSGPRTVSIEPALPGEDRRDAPTWEEPAAAPVEPEPAPSTSTPGPGRNLPAAVVSGALLAAAVIALLAVGKVPFAFFAGAAILLAQAELYAVIRARGGQPAAALGLVAGALVLVAAYSRGEQGALFVIVLAMALAVPWYMAAPEKGRRGTVNNAATTLLGFLYVPFLGSFAFQLLRADGVVGRDLLLTVLGLAVLYDICAYAIGSVWGNRALAPSISPQKSWEGAIGATFVLLVAGLSILPSIGPFQGRAGVAIGLALVIAVAAPLGDLVESALKRDLGVKDMGSILPGHGGVLDRIDSILLSAPAAWYFLRIVLT